MDTHPSLSDLAPSLKEYVNENGNDQRAAASDLTSVESALPILAPKRTTAFVREGKRIVKRTAVIRHGLNATDRVFVSCLSAEYHGVFKCLRAQLLNELDPHGPVETMLAEKIAISYLRYLKLSAIAQQLAENAVYQSGIDGLTAPHKAVIEAMERLARIETRIERTARTSLQEVKEAKKRRDEEAKIKQSSDTEVAA